MAPLIFLATPMLHRKYFNFDKVTTHKPSAKDPNTTVSELNNCSIKAMLSSHSHI